MAKTAQFRHHSTKYVIFLFVFTLIFGWEVFAASAEDINDYVATSDFSDPCDSGTLTAPDGATDDTISDFVAYCSGEETFGTCDDGTHCCDGTGACDMFTGWIKKDGSCDGLWACESATVPVIINGCIGDDSCTQIGKNGGAVGWVVNSCHDKEACVNLGWEQGSIGDLFYSCQGEYACQYLGGSEGEVGDLKYACQGIRACEFLGHKDTVVGNITSSCCSADSCSAYCQNGNNGEGPSCGENLQFYEDNNMCSGTAMPSASPSESLQPSSLPSQLPSISTIPTVSHFPSVSPSSQPSTVNRQIATTLNDIESGINKIASDIEEIKSDIDELKTNVNSPEANEVVEAKVEVVSKSEGWSWSWDNSSTKIIVLVTADSIAVDVYLGLLELFSLDEVTKSEVMVPADSITKLSTGLYEIEFNSFREIFWVKFSVHGQERTVMFKID